MEKKQIIRTLRLAAGAVFLSLLLALIMPGIPASTVHAKECRHEIFAWEEILAPTCSREGKKGRICQECDAILETAPVRKLDHKGEWKTTRDATCTLEGVKSFICRNCHAVVETRPVPKKNHSYKWVTTRPATCSVVGKKDRKCKNCGVISETAVIPTKKHSYKWVTTKEASCTSKGISSHKCKNCGSVGETKVLDMKKHKWGSWQIKKAAACNTEGTKVRACTVCKKSESESIKATGKHKYGNWEVKSITVYGQTIKFSQMRRCNVCGATQRAAGQSASFGKQHLAKSYYFKHTPKSGRIVILCIDCHKSVTGTVSDGVVDFTRPSRDNSKRTSKNWKPIS